MEPLEVAALLLRGALATVFLVSAVAKLTDRPGTVQAVLDFGFTPQISRQAAIAVPLIELLIAVGLLFVPTSPYAAAAALTLLLIFSVIIGWSLIHGQRPDCHCFGALSRNPIGSATLTRNGALAVASIVVIWLSSPNAGAAASAPETATTAVLLGLAVMVVTEFVFIAHLLRSERSGRPDFDGPNRTTILDLDSTGRTQSDRIASRRLPSTCPIQRARIVTCNRFARRESRWSSYSLARAARHAVRCCPRLHAGSRSTRGKMLIPVMVSGNARLRSDG